MSMLNTPKSWERHNSLILAQIRQVKNPLAITQRIDADGLIP